MQERKKKKIKTIFISGFIFLFSMIGINESMVKVTNYEDNISLLFLSIVSMVSLSLSSLYFLFSLINVVCRLFAKEENDKLEQQIAVSEIKIEKLMKINLNLKELNKLNPLLMKIKESLSEKELFDLMRTVEIRTNKQLGNAYYFFYLIKNYDDLVSEIKKQQKYDEDFKKQMSCFFNI